MSSWQACAVGKVLPCMHMPWLCTLALTLYTTSQQPSAGSTLTRPACLESRMMKCSRHCGAQWGQGGGQKGAGSHASQMWEAGGKHLGWRQGALAHHMQAQSHTQAQRSDIWAWDALAPSSHVQSPTCTRPCTLWPNRFTREISLGRSPLMSSRTISLCAQVTVHWGQLHSPGNAALRHIMRRNQR